MAVTITLSMKFSTTFSFRHYDAFDLGIEMQNCYKITKIFMVLSCMMHLTSEFFEKFFLTIVATMN